VTLSPDRIVDLEVLSARAWPAARQASIGGWRLNATSGFSGRINACWPLQDPGLPTADAVAAVEAWYAAQGLPALFKIVEGSGAPSSLTRRLADLGYRPRTETLMMLGPAAFAPSDPIVVLGEGVDPTFEKVFVATAADPGDARERLDTLARIPAPRVFARLDVAGSPAAIGAAAVEGDWVGVFAMRTDPNHRRMGLARRVLAALLGRAAEHGAWRAWLQVEADNRGAIALYAAAGFEEAYRYRYWFRPDPAG